jgi:hypothetical protein
MPIRDTAVANSVFLLYALRMVESQSPFAFLGLAFSISGVISLGYGFVERLVSTQLFSVFLTLVPDFLLSQFGYEPAIVWFKGRSTRSLYDCWDVSLIYLFLISLVLIMEIGVWVLLVLWILKVYAIRMYLLIILLVVWFAVLCFINVSAAVSQHYVEIKAQHKRATLEKVQEYMIKNPEKTFKRWGYYFLRNWVEAPYTTVKVLSIIVLFILLHWPAWLLKGVKILRADLNNKDTRTQYYITYGVLASVVGLLLTFFFR